MNSYKIVDNGSEIYTVHADSALKALTEWMLTYHNPEVLELMAEEGGTYIARIDIVKSKEEIRDDL